jgi:hypothetical protein
MASAYSLNSSWFPTFSVRMSCTSAGVAATVDRKTVESLGSEEFHASLTTPLPGDLLRAESGTCAVLIVLMPVEPARENVMKRYGDSRKNPEIVPAAGENWTMPTRISGPNAVTSEPSVFPSGKTKVVGLLAELLANADGTVPLIQSASV